MKLLTILGARPQFIKAAALSREIKNHDDISETILHTGQHFDENMSDIFFKEMDIPAPKYQLTVNSLSHASMTGQMMAEIDTIINIENPRAVIVYGDTNTTLAGAITAAKLDIPVIHIEAGLRSFNMKMPEEINRILTDRISTLLCCPTETAMENLKREGFDSFGCRVSKTGDLMEDATLFYREIAKQSRDTLTNFGLSENNFILATVHRAENTNSIENLSNIITALNHIAESISVIVPLHPRTKKIILETGIKTNFQIIDPVGYFDMINLIQGSKMVVTDSGGLQKEAFFFRKFCITMRNETEWTELIENGYNFICGTNPELIYSKFVELNSTTEFRNPINLYGNGMASQKIIEEIRTLF
jgi:UDP-GlcNAc3NAcA epimerase